MNIDNPKVASSNNRNIERKVPYENFFLGLPRPLIENTMCELNDVLNSSSPNNVSVNPELYGSLYNYRELCVEALHAKDCGDSWLITRAKGNHKTFKVKKSSQLVMA